MTFFVLSPKKLQSSDFKFLFFISIYWVILNKVEIFLPFSPIEFSRPGENCFHWVFIAPTLPLLQGRRISLSSVYPPPPPWINWLQDNDQDQNLQSQAPLIWESNLDISSMFILHPNVGNNTEKSMRTVFRS